MKPTRLHAALVLSGLLTVNCVFAAEKKAAADDASDSAKMAEMMKKMEAAGTPGASHKALDPLVGEWTAEVKAFMSPDAPPMVSKGTSKTTWLLDGRFVQEDFRGEMMGKPFRGMGLTGYDNQKQKYVNCWVDGMSTGIFTAEGTPSEDNKVITFEGTMDCPVTGEKNMRVKQVLRIQSPDRHTFEMFETRDGKTNRTMEISYTRK